MSEWGGVAIKHTTRTHEPLLPDAQTSVSVPFLNKPNLGLHQLRRISCGCSAAGTRI